MKSHKIDLTATESELDIAAKKLLLSIDDYHPDHPEKCAKLAAELEIAVEKRREIHEPVEGWDYWFGDSRNFRSYETALKLSKMS
jgi:hypothetical protein